MMNGIDNNMYNTIGKLFLRQLIFSQYSGVLCGLRLDL